MIIATEEQQTEQFTPAAFLRDLGIEPRKPSLENENSYGRAVRRAGGDPSLLARYGTFSPQAGDVFFINEKVARLTLSNEYDWFLRTLEDFDRIPGYPAAPRRIADLGGGTGIVAMYLAARHPGSRVVVFDHAPRQLKHGRRWARQRNIRNVEYTQASYQQLANGQSTGDTGDNDLVLFFRALPTLEAPHPESDTQAGVRPRGDVLQAMQAVYRLLSPEGVGVIQCKCEPMGFVQLFEAIRLAGLGVDWRWSKCVLGTKEGQSGIVEDRIFVRRNMPHLGRDIQEDAKAYINSAQGLRRWGKPGCDEEILLEGEGTSPEMGAEQVRLTQKEHWLLLEEVSAGCQRCWLHTLSGIAEMLSHAQTCFDRWEPGFSSQICPRLQRFIGYCQGIGTSSGGCEEPESSEAE